MQASHEQDPKQSRLTLSFEDPKLEVEFLHDLAMGLLKDALAQPASSQGSSKPAQFHEPGHLPLGAAPWR